VIIFFFFANLQENEIRLHPLMKSQALSKTTATMRVAAAAVAAIPVLQARDLQVLIPGLRKLTKK
jgi:hypothetical protein